MFLYPPFPYHLYFPFYSIIWLILMHENLFLISYFLYQNQHWTHVVFLLLLYYKLHNYQYQYLLFVYSMEDFLLNQLMFHDDLMVLYHFFLLHYYHHSIHVKYLLIVLENFVYDVVHLINKKN